MSEFKLRRVPPLPPIVQQTHPGKKLLYIAASARRADSAPACEITAQLRRMGLRKARKINIRTIISTTCPRMSPTIYAATSPI